MRTLIRNMFVGTALLAFSFAGGCADSNLENAGENLEEAAEETSEAVEEAAEDASDAVDDAVDPNEASNN